jgi:hypothetical protein
MNVYSGKSKAEDVGGYILHLGHRQIQKYNKSWSIAPRTLKQIQEKQWCSFLFINNASLAHVSQVLSYIFSKLVGLSSHALFAHAGHVKPHSPPIFHALNGLVGLYHIISSWKMRQGEQKMMNENKDDIFAS